MPSTENNPPRPPLDAFRSDLVDSVRSAGGAWALPGGQLLLPKVFGFCRGVERALAMLEEAVGRYGREGRRLLLLGEIIHNPYVNEHFRRRGVQLLDRRQLEDLPTMLTAADCAVIPAFGVPLAVERQLQAVGCPIVDTTCGDVRRLWAWAERAARESFGVVIFGRANHDETVVTRSRLQAVGGRYVVVGNLDEVRQLCGVLAGREPAGRFAERFGPERANTDSPAAFERLAQVSQTTMLFDETMEVRRLIREAFVERFGGQADGRLSFQPTVCRATQDRQTSAVELCRAGLDLAVVVGGFGSSNTRHLYDLARSYTPAYFIEDASAIASAAELHTMDLSTGRPTVLRDWLPRHRPIRVGVLAGASSPEIVIGAVLRRLAEFMGGQ